MIRNHKTRVVLLPGLHGTHDLFEPLLQHCPPEFDPLVISHPRDRELSYEELAGEVRTQITGYSPMILLGESYSGPLALRLASERPEGLVAVVLVGTFVLPPGPRWARFLPWELIFRMRTPIYVLRALVGGSPEDVAMVVKTAAILKNVSASVLATRLRSTLTVDARPWLAACPVPILYLAGAKDLVVRRHCLKSILRHRPDVVSRTLPTSHFILQLAPADAWKAITEFLQGETG
ncbi:MAG: alpha/beta hydrolase [Verrucomicrobiia bacterium]